MISRSDMLVPLTRASFIGSLSLEDLYMSDYFNKHCGSCNTDKEETEFGKRAASIDGLSAKCKSCQSIYDKKRANNPDRVKARADYSKTADGIDSGNRARKKWAANNKGKIYVATKTYREKNPNKSKAHGKVAYEIKLGNLTQKPCEVCGDTKVHGHHDDYSKALDVRWLCSKHHNEWHTQNGEGKNP